MMWANKTKWQTALLGNHLEQFTERNDKKNNLPVLSVSNDEGFTKSSDYFSKEVFSKNLSNYKIVSMGDFAYNPSRINVGSIDFLEKFERGLISPLYITFRVKENICPAFLKYYLKSNYGIIQIKYNTSGSVRDTLSFGGLSNIEMPLPPLLEQTFISAILDLADGMRRKRRQAIEMLDELLRATFLDMFGDPVKNPKGWEKRPLEKIGLIITGNTPPRSKSHLYGDYIEWIKSDNINTSDFFLTKAKEYLSKKGETVGRTVPSGSLLVTCIAGSKDCIGNVAIANREVAFNQQINAIVPNNSVKTKFLFAQFLYSKKLIQSYSTDGMKGLLIKSKFSKINFIVPPLHLQNQFTKIFETVECIREKMQNSLVEMDNLFHSLMQRAFKGELDLVRCVALRSQLIGGME